MANYDYFKQYVSEMERIKAKTAHDEHIMEFRAMVADMIREATPAIKQEAVEELRREQKAHDSANAKQKANLDIMIDTKDIKKQLMDALRKAFK